MSASTYNPLPTLVKELQLPARSIEAVIGLLNQGNTIPFIARYRKEATGNLDEVQIRNIQERLHYLLELEERRAAILKSIDSQGKLTDDLKAQILACETKNLLEDLYLPYKPKRRTRAMIAKEKGLEPLALLIYEQPLHGTPLDAAEPYMNSELGVATAEEALSGARDILAEMIAENAEIRATIRSIFANEGVIVSKVIEGKDKEPTKFEQYYNYQEKVSKIPSHRYLAIRRGEKEEILEFQIVVDNEQTLKEITEKTPYNKRSPFSEQLSLAIEDGYKRLIAPSIETDIRVDLKLEADKAAVQVFADNLRNLLLSSPLGSKSVLGIDPGIRTGCKCVAIDQTGKYLDTATIYPFQSEKAILESKKILLHFIKCYQPFAIAIGNGTAGRETEAFVRQVLAESKLTDIIAISVNESGASVYSASDIAREEFPDLDVTVRGAISIARRLQDPLAELVKIDPKAIGVGQYQHDVYQPMLQEKLNDVVESSVNYVGVELNTASAPLLSYVAGIGPSLAAKIVKHREQNGAFRSRKELLKVSGFGPKTFEQAAGFIRIRDAEHPLDSSAVHPERYALVEIIAKDQGLTVEELMKNHALIKAIDYKKYVNETVGMPTLLDICAELQKPGRDPRATFERPAFRDDVTSIKDLKQGMRLEGIVTNVTAFGAFVDIGVHQDGLVHISELTDRYVKDASEVVQVGDKIKVEVLSVDPERKRISLSAKGSGSRQKAQNNNTASGKVSKPNRGSFYQSPFASL